MPASSHRVPELALGHSRVAVQVIKGKINSCPTQLAQIVFFFFSSPFTAVSCTNHSRAMCRSVLEIQCASVPTQVQAYHAPPPKPNKGQFQLHPGNKSNLWGTRYKGIKNVASGLKVLCPLEYWGGPPTSHEVKSANKRFYLFNSMAGHCGVCLRQIVTEAQVGCFVSPRPASRLYVVTFVLPK